jgi:magnesium-transporting ATPase (P-type)
MSLIVRQRWDGKIVLFTKGADSVMLARVEPGQEAQAAIEDHLVGHQARC